MSKVNEIVATLDYHRLDKRVRHHIFGICESPHKGSGKCLANQECGRKAVIILYWIAMCKQN